MYILKKLDSKKLKKRKAVLAVRGMVIKNAIQKMTHDSLFDFQSNYIAISEIRDEKGVRSGNKNWSPRQSKLVQFCGTYASR